MRWIYGYIQLMWMRMWIYPVDRRYGYIQWWMRMSINVNMRMWIYPVDGTLSWW